MAAFHPLRSLPDLDHQWAMEERQPRPNEVRALTSRDGCTVFSIVRRGDGLFGYHEDVLCHDDEEDVYWWSQGDHPSDGLFGSPGEAEREIRANNAHLF
jgi:hypothetical protein